MTATYTRPSNTVVDFTDPTGDKIGVAAQKLDACFTDVYTDLNLIDVAVVAKAPKANPALTGTPTAPTAATGTNTTQIATTAFVTNTAFLTTLPGQTGNNGKVITTDGADASWSAVKTVNGTSVLGSGSITVQPTLESGTNIKTINSTTILGSGDIVVGTAAASQTQAEAGTDNTVMITPLAANWHPGACKAWMRCDNAGSIAASHNIASITDSGTGLVTVTIGADFSSANYAIVATCEDTKFCCIKSGGGAPTAGGFQLGTYDVAGTASDVGYVFVACFGDQ
jgi:hypothetical protein